MNRFSKSSALGAADPAGQPLQRYNQQQQWPNQDQCTDADPLDGSDPAGDQDDDLEVDDDLPIDPPEPKGSEVPEALKAERRKTNQLEHDIRVLKRQLQEFSKINPDEYERLQDAERQKVELERELASRERQLEAAAQRKVRAATKERDEAQAEVLNLRKERLLERLFLDAEGRAGGDNRGSFFEIFQKQVGSEFRLTTGSNGRDVLEPIDSKGNVLLGDHGNLDAASHVETLRTHPVLGFLFNQRGGLGPATVMAEFDGNGQATNLQAMSASELYLPATPANPPVPGPSRAGG
jgi:hypothetical protein